MLSNYGYGLTDNSPNTPWNEPSIPDHDFDVTVSVTLSKSTIVTTNAYMPDVDEEDGSVFYDTGDVDWDEEYGEQHLDIPELLEALQGLAKEKLEKCKDLSISEKNRLNRLIKEAGGWESTEKSVEEE